VVFFFLSYAMVFFLSFYGKWKHFFGRKSTVKEYTSMH
jgi:hypothetical protein